MTAKKPKHLLRKRGPKAGSTMDRAQLLNDAPWPFDIDFVKNLGDPELRTHLRTLYIKLKKESDNGSGITVAKDILLKRIVWCARILEKIEHAISVWDVNIIAGVPGAEKKLLHYMTFHMQQTKLLLHCIEAITVPMPPLKSIDQLLEKAGYKKSKVLIPQLEDLSDD